MLYDPEWEKPSLASFVGWLETKDPKQRYDFNNCQGECLVGQYMASIGIEWGEAPSGASRGDWGGTNYIKVARAIFGHSNPFNVLITRPWTFGAALARAREALAEQR